MLEKHDRIIILKDFYGPLLTEKQQTVLNLYYENDWSLSEIGEYFNITRQGVFDLLKRAEKLLDDYEQHLQLADKFGVSQHQLEQVHALLSQEDSGSDKIKQALELLTQAMDMV